MQEIKKTKYLMDIKRWLEKYKLFFAIKKGRLLNDLYLSEEEGFIPLNTYVSNAFPEEKYEHLHIMKKKTFLGSTEKNYKS